MLPDYRQAFADGVRHLASLGHTRIGTISYRLKDVEQSCRGFSREEYLSFLQTMVWRLPRNFSTGRNTGRMQFTGLSVK